MTAEELCKPRIKMIAPMPKIFACGIRVGQIWTGYAGRGTTLFNLTGAHIIDVEAVAKYSHLFKVLEWWECRKISDMPKYLKNLTENDDIRKAIKYYLKPDGLPQVSVGLKEPFAGYNREYLLLTEVLPATMEQYEAQQKLKTV